MVFFLGPAANRATINAQLYRDGEGLFPAPILGPLDLPEDPIASRSDVQFEKGGIFGSAGGCDVSKYSRPHRAVYRPGSEVGNATQNRRRGSPRGCGEARRWFWNGLRPRASRGGAFDGGASMERVVHGVYLSDFRCRS